MKVIVLRGLLGQNCPTPWSPWIQLHRKLAGRVRKSHNWSQCEEHFKPGKRLFSVCGPRKGVEWGNESVQGCSTCAVTFEILYNLWWTSDKIWQTPGIRVTFRAWPVPHRLNLTGVHLYITGQEYETEKDSTGGVKFAFLGFHIQMVQEQVAKHQSNMVDVRRWGREKIGCYPNKQRQTAWGSLKGCPWPGLGSLLGHWHALTVWPDIHNCQFHSSFSWMPPKALRRSSLTKTVTPWRSLKAVDIRGIGSWW